MEKVAREAPEEHKETGRMIERAIACHANGFESFLFFSVGILAAEVRNVNAGLVSLLAMAYLAFRVLYTYLYITGDNRAKAGARSLVWFLSLGCSCALMAFAAWKELADEAAARVEL